MLQRGIRGTVAAVKWSYFTAAAVHGYAVTQDRTTKTWTVTGSFVPGLVDGFKLRQRPIFFVAPFKRGAWRWEILAINTYDGGRFAATLGPLSTEDQHGITRPTAGN